MPQRIAVLTGDLIDSRLDEDGDSPFAALEQVLDALTKHYGARYQRFRGDGFQLALPRAEDGIEAAVLLRAGLMRHGHGGRRHDCRLAVAAGLDDWQPEQPLHSAMGEVFVASGLALDALDAQPQQPHQLRLIITDAPEDNALSVLIRYLDDQLGDWSAQAAEAVYLKLLHDETQQAIALRLGIRQPSVHKRLAQARWPLLAECLALFRERLARDHLSAGTPAHA